MEEESVLAGVSAEDGELGGMSVVVCGCRESGSELPHSQLAFVGGGGLAGGFGFGFSEEAVVAEFPENVKEENSGNT